MAWLPIALFAQFILATASVFDAIFLKRRMFDPALYAFWIGILGVFSLVLAPFGFSLVSGNIMILAFLGGAAFVSGNYFIFLMLCRGEASTILPAIGSLSPLATLILANIFFGTALGFGNAIGFSLLVLASFLLFLSEKKETRTAFFPYMVSAAILFGLSNVLSKAVFNHVSFINGFIWMRLGGVFSAAVFLSSPVFFKKIIYTMRHVKPAHGGWYLLNRSYAALGSVLISIAISRAHPALIDATQSVKFIIIFLAAWLILHERFSGRILWWKISATMFAAVGVLAIGAGSLADALPSLNQNRPIDWGVTFSDTYSRELGLNWQENYRALLNELHPKRIRLVAYWDEIEKTQGAYDFSNLDWQLSEASYANVKIILALGMKVPRWPECHIPEWAKNLPVLEREQMLQKYMQAVVMRYRDSSTITMWQIENEPFLNFGECPLRASQFLDREIELVKSLDASRPVLVTDGGELGLWARAVRYGDIFGTTMYRKVYPQFIGHLFGVIEYPLSPEFFRIKEMIVRKIIGEPKKRFIVSELQAEPWGSKPITELSQAEQLAIFGPDYFLKTIAYAKNTGFNEYYLWGSEWWYWLKIRGDARMWNIAKNLLK